MKPIKYIESDVSFRKRRYRYIPIGIILEIFLVLIVLSLVDSEIKSTNLTILAILTFPLTILLAIFIILRIYKGSKMTRFEIGVEGILDSSTHSNNWIDFSRISVIKYSLPTRSMIIYYEDNKNKLILEYLAKDDLSKIIKLFYSMKLNLQEVKGLLY